MGQFKSSKLKQYFQAGYKPTEENFADLIDSNVNKADAGISVDVEKAHLGIGPIEGLPKERLHVSGGIVLGMNQNQQEGNQHAGTLRWNQQAGQFQGYYGAEWRTFSTTPANEFSNRMYPSDPLVFQNIFEAAALGSFSDKTPYITKFGSPSYDASTDENDLWYGRHLIRYGDGVEQDGNGAAITIPKGYDTLWVRTCNDRWVRFYAYFLDENDGLKEELGQWCGGYRHANSYCPDGSLADSDSKKHHWIPIPLRHSPPEDPEVPKDRVAIINKVDQGPNKQLNLSGLAFSRNPWKHATMGSVGYYWGLNDSETISGQDTDTVSQGDTLYRIEGESSPQLKVPFVYSGKDKLLFAIEYNATENGCAHGDIFVNGINLKERFLATYDNPFARHWNSKIYQRYIAVRIPIHFMDDLSIDENTHFLTIRIDQTNISEDFQFREMGTHDLEVPVHH